MNGRVSACAFRKPAHPVGAKIVPGRLNRPCTENLPDVRAKHPLMTEQHPDLADEQAYIDHAYDCLDRSRRDAWKLRDLSEPGLGGTFQARYERDVFDEALLKRLSELELGDDALVFGRIDRLDTTGDSAGSAAPTGIEAFHIGRLAVADEHREPVVVDWRAPVAEPFYRATGKEPMGLVRRRHFAVHGQKLLGIEDELFGEGHLGIGSDGTLGGDTNIRGYSTLIAALERGRTGQLGDIVATIQAEQDMIIRSPQAGVLVVQGGPGTGKTVVALHRAAYLLYTYRFPLEDQGVLVIGPNRVFLRYIERVLPSLGEAGVELVVLGDLVPDVSWGGEDSDLAARVKGDLRMADVIEKAITDRERPLREDLVVPFRAGFLRLRAEESARIVRNARRRYRRHNAGRKFVESEVWSALAATSRLGDVNPNAVRDELRNNDDVRAALERMWPVLTAPQLLHDLFGSRALLRLAGSQWLSEAEYESLYRPRLANIYDIAWSDADAALLDEARALLGPRHVKGKPDESDEIRTYGHIVVDEVQDLTPMELRAVARRSLNGSMTIVGDLAQATGALAPDDWEAVLEHLPTQKGNRVVGLSIGYRIPGLIMELATRVMMAATPTLRAPTSVREGGAAPNMMCCARSDFGRTIAAAVRDLVADVGNGNVAVVSADSMVDVVAKMLEDEGIDHGRATRAGLSASVTLVPVSVAKGLELDGVVVVEPARIVGEQAQGMRALYVALTRSTKRLTVVHAEPLPAPMLG